VRDDSWPIAATPSEDQRDRRRREHAAGKRNSGDRPAVPRARRRELARREQQRSSHGLAVRLVGPIRR